MKYFTLISISILLTLLAPITSWSALKENYDQVFFQLRNQVLIEKNTRKMYSAQTTSDTACYPSRIQYLGTIETKHKKRYKLLAQSRVMEPSCRSVSSITIYNMDNQYIGEYSVGSMEYLPKRLQKNTLFFGKNPACPAQNGWKIQLQS